MTYYLSLILGLIGAFLLVGTLTRAVTFANGLIALIWLAASAAAVVWALNTLGVLA